MIENTEEKRAELLKVIPVIDQQDTNLCSLLTLPGKKYTWNGDWR